MEFHTFPIFVLQPIDDGQSLGFQLHCFIGVICMSEMVNAT